jgi:hypothetical protein
MRFGGSSIVDRPSSIVHCRSAFIVDRPSSIVDYGQ